MAEKQKKIYKKINTGIQGISLGKPSNKEITKFFEASENNIVFVNFHKEPMNNIEPFGKKELRYMLFKKNTISLLILKIIMIL